MVAANDTFPVPSKVTGEATISPVISKVLAVSSCVAVEIVPVIPLVNVETPETRSWDAVTLVDWRVAIVPIPEVLILVLLKESIVPVVVSRVSMVPIPL